MARNPRSPGRAFVSTLAGLLLFQVLLGCEDDPQVTGLPGAENAPHDETAMVDAEGPDAAQSDPAEAGAGDADAGQPGLGRDDDAAAPAEDRDATFDWAAGDYPPDLHEQTYLEISGVAGQAGKTRQYKVHVPRSYSAAVPAPVLFAFHGYTQNAVQFVVDSTTFVAKSEQDGFILVMPNGLQEDLIGGSWNAGTCCGEAAAQKLDDVALVRELFAAVRTHLNVDTSRVYATGLSNGGFISHRLGCEAADIFVAIAAVAAAIGTAELGPWLGSDPDPDLQRCEPVKPVAVLAVHGDADAIVPYPGMKASLDHWAGTNRCGAGTTAATLPASGGDTTCLSYVDCPQGIEVTGCTVKDGGHCWFGDPSGSCGTGFPGLGNLFVGNDSDFLDASDAAWAFLKRFRR